MINKEDFNKILHYYDSLESPKPNLNFGYWDKENFKHSIDSKEGLKEYMKNIDEKKRTRLITTEATIGSGKALWDEEEIPVYENGEIKYKRNGDLKIGDMVFNRKGKPIKITGVFPQGELDAYEVEFTNGNKVICNDEHLWTYYSSKGNFVTKTLKEIMEQGYKNLRGNPLRKVPTNEAIELPQKEFKVAPYAIGTLIGNGCCKNAALQISSNDPEQVQLFADSLELESIKKERASNYNWVFPLPIEKQQKCRVYYQTKDIIGEFPTIIDKYSYEKSIPEEYLQGSMEQRWELIQGLFDTDGSVYVDYKDTVHVRYSTTSPLLAEQIKDLLATMGIEASIHIRPKEKQRHAKHDEYTVTAHTYKEVYKNFFKLSRKKDIAMSYTRPNKRKYDRTTIFNIKKLNEKLPMTCIMVDDKEHLYCATRDFIVTHNTSLTSMLHKRYGGHFIPESVDDNPVLEDYYKDPEKFGYILQTYFLGTRYRDLMETYNHPLNLSDRHILADAMFFHINVVNGNATQTEYEVYQMLLDNMMKEWQDIPKRPELLIFIDLSFEEELRRIKKRGREFEQPNEENGLEDYYKQLHTAYQKWIKDYEEQNISPTLHIDGDKYDFVENLEDRQKVLDMIDDKCLELGLIDQETYDKVHGKNTL